MTIRGIIVDIVLLYGIIHFHKKNKYNDNYGMELSTCIFFFIAVTFLIGLNFVNFN